MTKTRGQAALEFLSTYGFAFLVILVMIGALSYFGVLSPGRFLPERCLVGAEFSCAEFQIERSDPTGGVVRFVLQNNLGNSVTYNVSSFSATSDFASANTCTITPETQVGGGTSIIECSLDQAGTSGGNILPAAGEKIRIRFDGRYTELWRTLPRSVQGEVFATVQ